MLFTLLLFGSLSGTGEAHAHEDAWVAVPGNGDGLAAFELAAAPVSNAQFAAYLTAALADGLVEVGAVTSAAVPDDYGLLTTRAVGGAYDGKELQLLGGDDCWVAYDGSAGQFYVRDAEQEDLPATYVRWHGAASYAEYYGYALPTGEQWEWAAQGARVAAPRAYPTATGLLAPELANYGSAVGRLLPVASYAPTELGLFDMAGQVWEWQADWFSGDREPPLDGSALLTEPYNYDTRAQRGGSWASPEAELLATHSRGDYPFRAGAEVGFRVARAVEAADAAAAAADSRVLFAGLCPAGQFQSYDSACEVCPPGHYCQADALTQCPPGTYGDAEGLSDAACSGACAPGFLCPAGSTDARTSPCGDYRFYCPAGSGARREVDAGYYSTEDRAAQTECEAGFFCPGDGLRYACPAGRLANATGLASEACGAECPLGHYCPESAPAPVGCPAGRLGNATGLTSAECAGPCPLGHYCAQEGPLFAAEPCPAGRYGPEQGLASAACSSACVGGACRPNECPEGSYCPQGSAAPTACDADPDARQLCPAGSAAPGSGSAGHVVLDLLREEPVPAGFYLEGNAAVACPAGSYNALEAQGSAEACLPCEAGYYCPDEGSTSPRARQCGDAAAVCAEGSAAPVAVPAGNYSTGGSPLRRTAQLVCPAGSFCEGGLRRVCPAGRYGSVEGLGSRECEGACAAGYWCGAGSVEAEGHACAAGRYGAGGSTDALCSGICAAGYYCPEASSSPTEFECLSPTLYCPAGSGEPLEVDEGHYTAGGTVSTRTHQVACQASSSSSLPLPGGEQCQFTSSTSTAS